MSLFEELRDKYQEFFYRGYEISEEGQELKIVYHFEIGNLASFHPKWRFPKGKWTLEELKKNGTFLKFVFSLGMVELVSYWKISCAPKVRILAGSLDDAQIAWWKELYYYGLGEFFYTNRIAVSMEEFMEIVSEGEKITEPDCPLESPAGCLVPIGGGKDSAVSLELMHSAGEKVCGYIINPRGATQNTVKAAGLSENELLVTHRTLDKEMLELNKKGFLNGHTPYSAIVAYSASLCAYLYGLRYVVLSNEASANESTVKGSMVNHQYSKSFKFEQDFHTYEETYIGSGTYYFSLLRPLSEFQIARYFAKSCIAYHEIFRSCNVGSKEDIWCGHCPKCLFVFFILSPFLPHKRICEIFGRDMTGDEAMRPLMEQLIGVQEEKPFECVGSRDEVNAAICLTIDRMEAEGETLPRLFAWYKNAGFYDRYRGDAGRYNTYFEQENLLPDKFVQLIKENCCQEG